MPIRVRTMSNQPKYSIEIQPTGNRLWRIDGILNAALLSEGFLISFLLLFPLIVNWLYRKFIPYGKENVHGKRLLLYKKHPALRQKELIYEEHIPENMLESDRARIIYHLHRKAVKGLIREDFIAHLKDGREKIFGSTSALN